MSQTGPLADCKGMVSSVLDVVKVIGLANWQIGLSFAARTGGDDMGFHICPLKTKNPA